MMNVRTKRAPATKPPASRSLPTRLLGFNIIRLAHVKGMRDDALFKASIGIGLKQFALLMNLSRETGLGAAQLARRLMITPQSVAPLIAELVELGLVEKDENSPRGARINVHMTRKGRTVFLRGKIVLRRTENETRENLSADEAAALNRLLIQIAESYVSRGPSESQKKSKRRKA